MKYSGLIHFYNRNFISFYQSRIISLPDLRNHSSNHILMIYYLFDKKTCYQIESDILFLFSSTYIFAYSYVIFLISPK